MNKFLYSTAVFSYMSEDSGEVVVHRDDVTWLHECAADYILCSTSLVNRKKIFLAEYILYSFLKALESL